MLNLMNELELQIMAATHGVPAEDHLLALVSRADSIETDRCDCQSGDWTNAEREQVASLLRREIETLRQIERAHEAAEAAYEADPLCGPYGM